VTNAAKSGPARGGVVHRNAALLAGGERTTRQAVPVVAHLDASERSEWWAAFKQQLKELGYVEGRDVTFETRTANGALEQLRPMALELVRLKVDVIVTSGTSAAMAAKRATSRIPIVMATGTDQGEPRSRGQSQTTGRQCHRPVHVTSELAGKRFELLRQFVPNTSRLAVLWHAENVSSMASIRDIEIVAAKSSVTLQPVGVSSAEELADAFSAMSRERAQAVIVIQTPLMYAERSRIAQLALKTRLPSMFGAAEYVVVGGLLSYAPSYPELYRHAAVYVDKILKGANPGELPIEEPNAFELVVNLGTARTLGLSIPAALLARVTRAIQ